MLKRNQNGTFSYICVITAIITTVLLQLHDDTPFLGDTAFYIVDMMKAFSISGFIGSIYFEKQKNIIWMILAMIPLISFFIIK